MMVTDEFLFLVEQSYTYTCLFNSGDREHFFVVTEDLLRLLNDFYRRPVVKTLAAEHGLDSMY